MTIKQAAKILTAYNKWRRGGKAKQPDPVKIGEAIDTLLKYVNEVDRNLQK